MKLGVVGYGKMGSSLVRGAIASGVLRAMDVRVMDLDDRRMEAAKGNGLPTVRSLGELSDSYAILLSVKPRELLPLFKDIAASMDPKGPLFISIAAGLRLESLEKGLGHGSRVVRVMPNLPASVGEAASVFVMKAETRGEDRRFVEALLSGVGKAYELGNEDLIDAVTGISGSGPAYFFMVMQAMEAAALGAGLPEKMARSLIAQTCRGSGSLALESNLNFDELIKAVASPGGTTEEALRVLESRGIPSAIKEAILAAIEKSKNMGHG